MSRAEVPGELLDQPGFTTGSMQQGWSLTRLYYQGHGYHRTPKAITKAFKDFATVARQSPKDAETLASYFQHCNSLDAESLEKKLRANELLSLNTPPWGLVKEIKQISKLLKGPDKPPAHSPSVQKRKQRASAAKSDLATREQVSRGQVEPPSQGVIHESVSAPIGPISPV